MLNKLIPLFLTVSIVLSACGTLNVTLENTPSPVPSAQNAAPTDPPPASLQPGPTQPLPDQPLSMDSSSDAIRQVMLHSAINWKTIWMDGVIYESMDSNGNPVDGTRQQVWIDQSTARFRVLSGPADGGAATRFKVSDGVSILDMNLSTGATQARIRQPYVVTSMVSIPKTGSAAKLRAASSSI